MVKDTISFFFSVLPDRNTPTPTRICLSLCVCIRVVLTDEINVCGLSHSWVVIENTLSFFPLTLLPDGNTHYFTNTDRYAFMFVCMCLYMGLSYQNKAIGFLFPLCHCDMCKFIWDVLGLHLQTWWFEIMCIFTFFAS